MDADSENVDHQRWSRFDLHERTDGGRMEGRAGYGRNKRDGVNGSGMTIRHRVRSN